MHPPAQPSGLQQLPAAAPGTCCRDKSCRPGCGASKRPCRGGAAPRKREDRAKLCTETEGIQHQQKIPGPFSTSPAQTLRHSTSCITSATRDATRFVPRPALLTLHCSQRGMFCPGWAALGRGGAKRCRHAAVPHRSGNAITAEQRTLCSAHAGLPPEAFRAEISLGVAASIATSLV